MYNGEEKRFYRSRSNIKNWILSLTLSLTSLSISLAISLSLRDCSASRSKVIYIYMYNNTHTHTFTLHNIQEWKGQHWIVTSIQSFVSSHSLPKNYGYFFKNLVWLIQNTCIQTFPPMILLYRRNNYWVCTPFFCSLSYPLRSLIK